MLLQQGTHAPGMQKAPSALARQAFSSSSRHPKRVLEEQAIGMALPKKGMGKKQKSPATISPCATTLLAGYCHVKLFFCQDTAAGGRKGSTAGAVEQDHGTEAAKKLPRAQASSTVRGGEKSHTCPATVMQANYSSMPEPSSAAWIKNSLLSLPTPSSAGYF